jgi:hypothetical protein
MMYVNNEYANAIPATEPTTIFLNQHTPTGLFMGQNTQSFWVVLNESGKWAIQLSDLYTPMFAAFPLDNRRLDYGWDQGEAQLTVRGKMCTDRVDDAGVIRIENGAVAMCCCRPDGTLTWLTLGSCPEEGLSGYFDSWHVCYLERSDHVVAERHEGIYGTDQFTPFFPV